MNKIYDATKEFSPFEKTGNLNGRHPRTRTGATAKQLKRRMRQAEAPVAAPAKKKK
jgi:hypothetical protein